ncbi:MAG: GGDEF domain-containing protein [Kiloniellaceae bacterium]
MNLSHVETEIGPFGGDPVPPLCAAADRLRRLAARRVEPVGPSERELIDQVLAAAARAEQALAVQRARIRHLESLSMTDELTGLLNRRGLRLELDRALARAQRSRETGQLVLCDLDRFKAINDSYGHMAGDAVLCAVAGLLQAKTRRSDYVARLGGDEFAVLLTQSAPAQAEPRMTTLARAVNGLIVEWNGHRIPVTASFGAEGYHWGSQPETLLFLADRALYRHKGPRLVSTTPDRAAS